ncbi:hypothetical protein Tco_0413113 [Tanacetum coccineum]
MGLWYPKDTGFELTAFSYSDHVGYLDSRKSTFGGIQFLNDDKLVSWSSKKQECTSMSLAEAAYVAKGIVELFFVGTEYQLADLFTKALLEDRKQEWSLEMLLSIHHSLKMLLYIISKMNRKLEDEKVKRIDKGKEKVNDF